MLQWRPHPAVATEPPNRHVPSTHLIVRRRTFGFLVPLSDAAISEEIAVQYAVGAIEYTREGGVERLGDPAYWFRFRAVIGPLSVVNRHTSARGSIDDESFASVDPKAAERLQSSRSFVPGGCSRSFSSFGAPRPAAAVQSSCACRGASCAHSSGRARASLSEAQYS